MRRGNERHASPVIFARVDRKRTMSNNEIFFPFDNALGPPPPSSPPGSTSPTTPFFCFSPDEEGIVIGLVASSINVRPLPVVEVEVVFVDGNGNPVEVVGGGEEGIGAG